MAGYEYTMGKDLDLKVEQEKTLQSPPLPYNFILKMMFWGFDVVYGAGRTLPKIKTLEILARYPYWAWENGSYHRLSRWYARLDATPKAETDLALSHIAFGREAQDNEQWHMVLVDDIMRRQGIQQSWLKGVLIPRVMALGYYFLTRLMYWTDPGMSFAMNAAFEDHAEHEYMRMAQEHPEWENEPVESEYFQYYPQQKSLADLLRRISLDERDHKHASLEALERWRNR